MVLCGMKSDCLAFSGKGKNMIIQIYEIQTPREADQMIALGVDHVGSVLLSMDQWQDARLHETVRLVQSSGRKSSLIPLFNDVDTISRAVDYYQPDILHFCEVLPSPQTDPDRLNAVIVRQQTIKQRYPEIEIMRSIPIGTRGWGDASITLTLGALFGPWSDWFLTDTLIGKGAGPDDQDQPVPGYVGITGLTCDWDIARRLVRRSRIPVILAGGIGPGNVADGILRVRPAGVDSCTLTNAVAQGGKAQRFKKDPEKVKTMIHNAHRAAGENKGLVKK
jgi:phosphoribosylanthranilate isomerase